MQYLKVTKVEDVTLYRRGSSSTGTLHLTTHHIIFTMDNKSEGRPMELWFCYPMIERVDFNRGSALLYKNGGGGANGVDNGITDTITNSANEFTSSLTNGISNLMSTGFDKEKKKEHIPMIETIGKKSENLIDEKSSTDLDMIGQNDDDQNNELEFQDGKDNSKLCRGACIRIQFRDFHYISFDFKNILKGNDVFDTMMKLTCVENVDKLYAFIYQPIKIEQDYNSWDIYNVEKEFERQGLEFDKEDSTWRLSKLNKDYKLCESYPGKVVIPNVISDTILGHTVKYRSKNRFPALSYYYKPNGCSIVRCSQPLVGIKQNRSIQDETLIQEVFKTNKLLDAKNLIVDARPITNAMAQVALGAGTEIMENYGENSKKIFLNIENIHVMRDSLNKIKMLLKNSDVDGCQKTINLDSFIKSGWLEHISRVLKGTDLLVKHLIYEGVHLIVHCSDGWDRTSQICSLVEVCIDPFYRTIDGFIILIEKEWISFGHRFNERCGHVQQESKFYNHTNEEGNFQRKIKHLNQRYKHQKNMKFESPVFQQFLDCIYQLQLQYPKAFEFNERFLRRLVYHLYSCQYGTFLQDREKDKYEWNLPEKTRSVWDYFRSRKREFSNTEYDRESSADVLDVNYTKIVPWNELYGRAIV